MNTLTIAFWLALATLAPPGAPHAGAAASDTALRVEVRHADSAVYDGLSHRIVLAGAVHVVRGTMSMRADQIEIILTDDEREVRQASASGRVEIVDGARRARAAQAVYDYRTSEIVLLGAPSLWDGPNQIEADRIIYNAASRAMRAEGRVRAFLAPAGRR